jgi:hypothetical protein
MPFTLWSHNQLLGETSFELGDPLGRKRIGVFNPSPLGATLMPTLTGIGPALLALGRRVHETEPIADDPASMERLLRETTEGSAVIDFAKRLHALDLELRDPEGQSMSTESIGVHDTHQFTYLADGEVPATAIDFDRPRYFLSATLPQRRVAKRRTSHVH